MNLRKSNLLLFAGLISVGFGIVGAVPSFMRELILTGVLSTFLIVGGLILVAISFGEEHGST